MTQTLEDKAREALELDGKATEGPWDSQAGEYLGSRLERSDVYDGNCLEIVKDGLSINTALIARYRTLCPELARGYLEMLHDYQVMDEATDKAASQIAALEAKLKVAVEALMTDNPVKYSPGVKPAPESNADPEFVDSLAEGAKHLEPEDMTRLMLIREVKRQKNRAVMAEQRITNVEADQSRLMSETTQFYEERKALVEVARAAAATCADFSNDRHPNLEWSREALAHPLVQAALKEEHE